jgi:hypothetical protein
VNARSARRTMRRRDSRDCDARCSISRRRARARLGAPRHRHIAGEAVLAVADGSSCSRSRTALSDGTAAPWSRTRAPRAGAVRLVGGDDASTSRADRWGSTGSMTSDTARTAGCAAAAGEEVGPPPDARPLRDPVGGVPGAVGAVGRPAGLGGMGNASCGGAPSRDGSAAPMRDMPTRADGSKPCGWRGRRAAGAAHALDVQVGVVEQVDEPLQRRSVTAAAPDVTAAGLADRLVRLARRHCSTMKALVLLGSRAGRRLTSWSRAHDGWWGYCSVLQHRRSAIVATRARTCRCGDGPTPALDPRDRELATTVRPGRWPSRTAAAPDGDARSATRRCATAIAGGCRCGRGVLDDADLGRPRPARPPGS